MPKTPVNPLKLTAKQAKAAYKARGQTISDAERKRLARGAELLERAQRIKQQEKRKRELRPKQGEKQHGEKQGLLPELLGTQLRLDKFGHKSSQYHLGKFVKKQTSRDAQPSKPATKDPWEDDDLDEDSLLDAVRTERPPAPERPSNKLPTTTLTPSGLCRQDSAAHVLSGAGWAMDDFIDSSTQIARDLQPDKITHESTKQTQWPSFSADDAWIEEGMEDIEKVLEQAEASFSQGSNRGTTEPLSDTALMPPPKGIPDVTGGDCTPPADSMRQNRSLMPPPKAMTSISRRHPVQPSTSGPQKRTAPSIHPPQQRGSPLIHTGISMADLESLAESDILLSQFFAA